MEQDDFEVETTQLDGPLTLPAPVGVAEDLMDDAAPHATTALSAKLSRNLALRAEAADDSCSKDVTTAVLITVAVMLVVLAIAVGGVVLAYRSRRPVLKTALAGGSVMRPLYEEL